MWANLAAAVLVALLKAWWAREDFRASVYRQVERQQAQQALAALGWKVDALARPDRGAGLGVRSPGAVVVPRDDPPAGGGAH